MREQEGPKIQPWLAWLRISTLAFTGLVAILWISSYFVGIQRYQSNWSQLDETTVELATWLFSNYGSIGLAWRSQGGELGGAPPPSSHDFKTFDGSPTALGNIHPKGVSSWHWIHYEPTKSQTMGSMRAGYGHLYVPYWMLFFAGCLSWFVLRVHIKRRAKKHKESSDCALSGSNGQA